MSGRVFWCLLCSVCFQRYSADTTCPDNWIPFQGSCYYIGHSPLTFSQSELFCSQHHSSHLIHVNDAAESAFIKDALRYHDPHEAWVGLTDSDIESIWKWIDDDSVAQYTDWSSGEPNDAGGEDCAIFRADHNYQWNDVPCDNQHLFLPVCELQSEETIVG